MASAYLNPSLIADSAPTPNLQQNSPVNIMEGVARVKQLQQAAQQQQSLAPIQQQQAAATLQQTQVATEKSKQDLADQQSFGQAIRDSGGDPDKLVQLANQTITDPWMLARVDNMASQMKERNTKTTADQDARTATVHGQYVGKLQSVIDALNSGDTAGATKLWNGVASQALTEKDPNGQSMVPQSIDPNTLPTAAALQNYQTYLSGSKDFLAQQAKLKEQNALAALNSSKAIVANRQASREDIADMYRSVASPEDHATFMDQIQKKYPDVAGEYSNLPYDPDNTPDTIADMTMSRQKSAETQAKSDTAAARQTSADAATANAAARQTSANAAMTRAQVAGGRAGMVARANDPTASPAQHAANQQALADFDANGGLTGGQKNVQQRYQERVIAADTKQHSDLEAKKQQNQALDQNYQSALRKAFPKGFDLNTTDPDGLNTDVQDPKTGKTITAGQAVTQMRAARAVGADQAAQQQQIEKRRGWGQFAPAQTTAPQGGTAPPPAAAPAPVTKTFPRSQLGAFAAKNKMTPAQAETSLTQQGYQVTQQ